jgi:serine/threonine protein phosphatase PrpC
MLRVVDVGSAEITKRDKMFSRYGVALPIGVPNGQDSHIIDRKFDCYAVADGVGGSPGSDRASSAVCLAYRDAMKRRYGNGVTYSETDREATQLMLDEIHTAALGALALTTFTGLAIHPNDTATYLHVGDSQLLLLRHDVLTHITSEHVHEDGRRLFNYLGSQAGWDVQGYGRRSTPLTVHANVFSETKLEAEWGEIRLQDGDRFALVTDGITGSEPGARLSNVAIKYCLRHELGASESASELLVASLEQDDSTVVVVDIARSISE